VEIKTIHIKNINQQQNMIMRDVLTVKEQITGGVEKARMI
jgi:hypothetical protein|tara:strand:- start:673 stop:792 length:120 start_codon:yes stop_codon:yes gene_type:complete